jgi:hypothetical protein
MLKKTAIATATAGLLALGTLAIPSAASAGGYGPGPSVNIGGPGWSLQFGAPPPHACRPVYKNVKWWDRWGRPHWKKIQVRDCHRHGPPPPFYGPGPGFYGPGPYGPGPW